MNLIKQSVLFAVAAVASIALAGGSASAAISPDPYSFGGSDGGAFVARTVLGTARCNISALSGRLDGTAGGALGSITAASPTNCTGVITSATALPPWTVEIDNGNVIMDISTLITNALGGGCLYAGTLSGTAVSPTSAITASTSAFPLDMTLSGFCWSTMGLSVSLSTGASISW